MFSKTATIKSTNTCYDKISQLKYELETANAVVIGAGAGLSTSAGLDYSGGRFERYFGDFQKKYGIRDMYSGGFYPFASLEEHWAWWSRQIMLNRYGQTPKPVYEDLLGLVNEKDYFVLTTNVDHKFQLAGFDKKRLFYTQGDYGLWQCSKPCHQETYDNQENVRQMVETQGFCVTENGMELPAGSFGVKSESNAAFKTSGTMSLIVCLLPQMCSLPGYTLAFLSLPSSGLWQGDFCNSCRWRPYTQRAVQPASEPDFGRKK